MDEFAEKKQDKSVLVNPCLRFATTTGLSLLKFSVFRPGFLKFGPNILGLTQKGYSYHHRTSQPFRSRSSLSNPLASSKPLCIAVVSWRVPWQTLSGFLFLQWLTVAVNWLIIKLGQGSVTRNLPPQSSGGVERLREREREINKETCICAYVYIVVEFLSGPSCSCLKNMVCKKL